MSDKKELNLKPVEKADIGFLYSRSSENDKALGCIGHLRADFGSGKEFYTTWWPHQGQLKDDDFVRELDEVVNYFRRKGRMLASRKDMRSFVEKNPAARIRDDEPLYGFRMDSEKFSYFFRCFPLRGNYDLYLYCYRREILAS